jgi:hypothetical protein
MGHPTSRLARFVLIRCYARIHQVVLVPVGATHVDLVEALSHVCCRQVLRMVTPMELSSHACCYWIEGEAIVTGGKAVWNVSVYRRISSSSI